MKVTLDVSLKAALAEQYYHIICLVEGNAAEKDAASQVMQMLWTRLSAGKKSYARRVPEIALEEDFESDKITLRGGFRLTTTDEDGGMVVTPNGNPALYGYGAATT